MAEVEMPKHMRAVTQLFHGDMCVCVRVLVCGSAVMGWGRHPGTHGRQGSACLTSSAQSAVCVCMCCKAVVGSRVQRPGKER